MTAPDPQVQLKQLAETYGLKYAKAMRRVGELEGQNWVLLFYLQVARDALTQERIPKWMKEDMVVTLSKVIQNVKDYKGTKV